VLRPIQTTYIISKGLERKEAISNELVKEGVSTSPLLKCSKSISKEISSLQQFKHTRRWEIGKYGNKEFSWQPPWTIKMLGMWRTSSKEDVSTFDFSNQNYFSQFLGSLYGGRCGQKLSLDKWSRRWPTSWPPILCSRDQR